MDWHKPAAWDCSDLFADEDSIVDQRSWALVVIAKTIQLYPDEKEGFIAGQFTIPLGPLIHNDPKPCEVRDRDGTLLARGELVVEEGVIVVRVTRRPPT